MEHADDSLKIQAAREEEGRFGRIEAKLDRLAENQVGLLTKFRRMEGDIDGIHSWKIEHVTLHTNIDREIARATLLMSDLGGTLTIRVDEMQTQVRALQAEDHDKQLINAEHSKWVGYLGHAMEIALGGGIVAVAHLMGVL